MEAKRNYAFLDGANLYLGIRDLGWNLDYKKFREFLSIKYNVEKAYLFLGNVPRFNFLYKSLQEKGYILILKPTIPNEKDELKGNVDADLVLQTMIDYNNYRKAIIVSGDGDFYSLVRHLCLNGKMLRVIAPNKEQSSCLLRKEAGGYIIFLDQFKEKLQFIKIKNTANKKSDPLARPRFS
ncbi:MAG: NYN domain-containing protein [bacterium]|nr:NYN domain-containing protein [bacterium]